MQVFDAKVSFVLKMTFPMELPNIFFSGSAAIYSRCSHNSTGDK